ncbi:hypothetical protein [Gallaecimonas sp. GXIMD4217]|uniref:hypothetical protein n=1 Tax=Gallaecimonas sp. GXIMD4217 TaxID=3131927 RepID=UPI00311AC563
MKLQQWQGQWQGHKLEVHCLPRLTLTEVRLLVDGELRDQSTLFRAFKSHRLLAWAKPEAEQGLIQVDCWEVGDGNGLKVQVDGEVLEASAGSAPAQPANLALLNGLLSGLGAFVLLAFFILVFNLIDQGWPLQQLPSPWPALIFGAVMALFHGLDTHRRRSFRDQLSKKAP